MVNALPLLMVMATNATCTLLKWMPAIAPHLFIMITMIAKETTSTGQAAAMDATPIPLTSLVVPPAKSHPLRASRLDAPDLTKRLIFTATRGREICIILKGILCSFLRIGWHRDLSSSFYLDEEFTLIKKGIVVI